MLLRIFQLRCELIDSIFLLIELNFVFIDLSCQVRYFWNLLSNDLKLSLSFFELKIIHSYFFFLLSDCLLSVFHHIFIDIWLLVQDTQFIILVNELNTLIISWLTGHFILKDQCIHLFLQRVDNQIQFVTFIDFLSNNTHLVFILELFLVQFSSVSISQLNFSLNILFAFSKYSIFLSWFMSQNFNFILENFNSFLHFCKILRGILNLTYIFISIILDVFIKSEEWIEFELNFLLLFGQIKNEEFLNFKLFLCLSCLSHCLWSSTSHFLSDCWQEFNFDNKLVFLFQVFSDICFKWSNISI